MTEHKRREGYWQYYEAARGSEPEFVRRVILVVIRENPHPPRKKNSTRGRKRTHSIEKLDYLCLLKIAKNIPFQDVPDELASISDEWEDEPHPDRSWLIRHMKTIDIDWLDSILVDTARMCLKELEKSNTESVPETKKETTCTNETADSKQDVLYAGPSAHLACDSSAIETDRYEMRETCESNQQCLVESRVRTYQKYHITAITGPQIILSSHTTPSNVNDTSMLPIMIDDVTQNYPQLAGCVFNADKGYDSDQNCELLFKNGFIPNISQRSPAEGTNCTNEGKPSRKKAGEIFDPEAYKQRSLIEAIFGADETRGHRLFCRMRCADNRKRFGKMLSISWNLRVLHRFICAHKKGCIIPSYA